MGLFKPAWMDDESSVKAKMAVEKTTDQAELFKIAKKAPCSSIRVEAVKKLTDQASLEYIAQNDEAKTVRQNAVEKLTNQAIIASVAQKDSDEYIRRLATEKLTNQVVLTYIANNDQSIIVKKMAAYKLENEEMLVSLLIADPNPWKTDDKFVRSISNPKQLARLVIKCSNKHIVDCAVDHLQDDESLRRILVEALEEWKKVGVYTKLPEYSNYAKWVKELTCWYDEDKRLEAAQKLIDIAKTKPGVLLPIWTWLKEKIETPRDKTYIKNRYDLEEAGYYEYSGIGLVFPDKP